ADSIMNTRPHRYNVFAGQIVSKEYTPPRYMPLLAGLRGDASPRPPFVTGGHHLLTAVRRYLVASRPRYSYSSTSISDAAHSPAIASSRYRICERLIRSLSVLRTTHSPAASPRIVSTRLLTWLIARSRTSAMVSSATARRMPSARPRS